jgi:hypothetical protein
MFRLNLRSLSTACTVLRPAAQSRRDVCDATCSAWVTASLNKHMTTLISVDTVGVGAAISLYSGRRRVRVSPGPPAMLTEALVALRSVLTQTPGPQLELTDPVPGPHSQYYSDGIVRSKQTSGKGAGRRYALAQEAYRQITHGHALPVFHANATDFPPVCSLQVETVACRCHGASTGSISKTAEAPL